MKTYLAPINEIEKNWLLVDADGKVLGRLATEIASRLRGKHKPTYSTFMDNGDFVVVVNAEKIRLTGNKWDDKQYHHHTSWMGGLKTATAREMLEKKPTEIIRLAVQGMLPKNSLGRAQLKKLKIYVGTDHPHAAQQPAAIEL
ncbi:MAG: 50S ribosomal protein L13 [Desulfobulbaceae bacterium]|nr:50S ribosomal protein L13 [Desulfobulbaceae bacterium]